MYEVIVGNIGTVHRGSESKPARAVYAEYLQQSKSQYGRAAGESVTLTLNGEPIKEYIGPRDLKEHSND